MGGREGLKVFYKVARLADAFFGLVSEGRVSIREALPEIHFLENTLHSLANQRIEKLEKLLRRRIFGFAEIVVQGAVITVPLAIGSDGDFGLPEHLFKA